MQINLGNEIEFKVRDKVCLKVLFFDCKVN